jgi:hypothetical protein
MQMIPQLTSCMMTKPSLLFAISGFVRRSIQRSIIAGLIRDRADQPPRRTSIEEKTRILVHPLPKRSEGDAFEFGHEDYNYSHTREHKHERAEEASEKPERQMAELSTSEKE